MAPLIIPFVIVYFSFAWFVAKYQFLYVSMPNYESGGKFFPIVWNRILIGMFVYQIMMWGIFGLKKSYISFLLLPLPFMTGLFAWYAVVGEHGTLICSGGDARAQRTDLPAAGVRFTRACSRSASVVLVRLVGSSTVC